MELTSLHKHVKVTSTCKAILTENKQETGRKTLLQLRLQISTRSQVGREEKQAGQDPLPYEGTQEKRGISWAQRCPPGREKFEDLLASMKTSGTYKRAVGNLDSTHEECAHMLAHSCTWRVLRLGT